MLVQRRLQFAAVGLAALLSARALAQPAPAANGAPDARLEAAAVDALVSKAAETPEEAEEITVQGRRRGDVLGKYRLEMTKARDNIVEVFNEVNTKNDTDVKCRTEKPTGTRMAHSICRSKAEDDAQASAAKGMLQALVRGTSTGGGANVGGTKFATATAAPAISPTASPGTVGSAVAQNAGEGGSAAARTALEAEMKKMMAENRELFRAVVKYVELRDEYDKARGASDDGAAN